MNADKLTRATFVLDRETSEDLSYLAHRFGQSRSALVRGVLAPSISDLARVVRQVPDNPTPRQVGRFRREGLRLVDAAQDEVNTALGRTRG